MSVTPITGQKKPFVCFCCRKTIKNFDHVFVALDSHALHFPKGYDMPEVRWITDMDWSQEFYFHYDCFLEMKNREWSYQLNSKPKPMTNYRKLKI